MWQPIDTAPKDRCVLLYGVTCPGEVMVQFRKPKVFSGYWSRLDESWTTDGSHWDGPFVDPTHWMPLPDPPK